MIECNFITFIILEYARLNFLIQHLYDSAEGDPITESRFFNEFHEILI